MQVVAVRVALVGARRPLIHPCKPRQQLAHHGAGLCPVEDNHNSCVLQKEREREVGSVRVSFRDKDRTSIAAADFRTTLTGNG